MCFVLYAGTSTPMARKEWRNDVPDLSVKTLTERESPITNHFSTSEVQRIGSTAGCGCDFPHVMFQNGEWPWFEDEDELDRQTKATEQYNREGLVTLLRQTGEPVVELYGVWDGNFDFRTPPAAREQIRLDAILDPAFRFKEQGLYVVRLA